MAAVEYGVDCDAGLCVVEWQRASGSTRLLEIVLGDTVGIHHPVSGEYLEVTVTRYEKHASTGAVMVHLDKGKPLHINEFLNSWLGCWVG